MHVERDVDQILGHRLADQIALVIGRELEELLAEVVAKRIGHEVGKVLEGLSENHIPMLRNTFLELLLQIAAPMLILAQGSNFALHVFQADPSKSVDCYVMSKKTD